MKHTMADQCLALAAVFQAAQLVQRVAHGAATDDRAREAILGSILRIDAPTVPAVFGDTAAVRSGLLILKHLLSSRPSGPEAEMFRYVINLLQLERKLIRRKSLLAVLRQDIRAIGELAGGAESASPEVLGSLARLYQKTISTLTPRIMVQGDPRILADNQSAELIRALLLGGIRAAVLWRQCGGNRLGLLIRRRAILSEVDNLLGSLA